MESYRFHFRWNSWGGTQKKKWKRKQEPPVAPWRILYLIYNKKRGGRKKKTTKTNWTFLFFCPCSGTFHLVRTDIYTWGFQYRIKKVSISLCRDFGENGSTCSFSLPVQHSTIELYIHHHQPQRERSGPGKPSNPFRNSREIGRLFFSFLFSRYFDVFWMIAMDSMCPVNRFPD